MMRFLCRSLLLALLLAYGLNVTPVRAQEHADEHDEHDDHDEHDEHEEGHLHADGTEHHDDETAEEHAAHEHGHDDHDHDHAHEHGDNDVTFSAIVTNSKFQITVATFLVLLVLLNFGYRKAGKPALVARRREIEENLAEAQAKKAEAEALRAEYKSRLEKMEEELAQIRAEMVKAGETERDRIVQEAETKAATMRKDTEFQISQKMKQLRDDLKKEAAMAAVAAAEEVIKAKVGASDQSRLAEDYLTQIAAVAAQEKRP